MKNVKNISVLFFMFFAITAFSQKMPKGFKEQVRKEYVEGKGEIKEPFETYYKKRVEARKSYINFLKSVAQNKSVSDLCSNGTFENGEINTGDWMFYWNQIGGNYPNMQGGTNRINTGTFLLPSTATWNDYMNIAPEDQVHHKVVPADNDPTEPNLSTVPSYPSNNNYSLRLGNRIIGYGKEAVAKKITITPSNSTLTFSYALVLNNPATDHAPSTMPYFKVQIFDASISLNDAMSGFYSIPSALDYSNLVDLGNGQNVLIANNPLLQPVENSPFGDIVYKDWSCVTVDLSSLIGKTVIIVFETRDCTQKGDFGYAYIDNICLSCEGVPSDEGSIERSNSDECGLPGKICVDYTLPVNPNNNQTGNGKIYLELIQNGSVVNTLSSPTLNSGSNYCFNLNTGNTSGLNTSLSGFDYRIKGQFSLGNINFAPQFIGNAQEGVTTGQNNDYQLDCPIELGTPCKSCMGSKAGVLSQTQVPVAVNNPVNSQIKEAIEYFKAYSGNIPITEIRIAITDFKYEYNYKDCQKCSKDAGKWGNIYTTTNNINGLTREGQQYENNNINGTAYQQYGAVREIVWKSSTGVLFPNGTSSQFDIRYILPPLSEIPCCAVKATYCVKITIKDANCCYKEIYSCSTISLE